MKVKTEINRIDLIRFNLSVLPRLRSTYVLVAVMSSTILALILLTKGFPQTDLEWFAIITAPLLMAISTLIAIVLVTVVMLLTLSLDGILGRHDYELRDDGLYEETDVNQGLSKWEGVWEVRVVGSYVLFRISSYMFHIIPKRSFLSEEELDAFVAESEQKWCKLHTT